MSGEYPNSKVYLERGAERIVVEEQGYFKVDGNDFTGQKLGNFMKFNYTKTIKLNSAGVLSAHGGSAQPILQSGGGYFIFALDSVASNASCRLPSAELGQILHLNLGPATSAASVLFLASNSGLTGVSIEGIKGSALSALGINQAGSADPYVKMVCFTEGTWSVVEEGHSGPTEYPAA